MKKVLLHGLTAGVFAGIVGIIYNYAYTQAMWIDFSSIINPVSIIGASLFGTILAALGHHFFSKLVKKGTDVWFNIIFLVLSFASFVGSFATELPLDVESPELFPGLSVPMHLFPILFWLATKPLFDKKEG